MWFKNVVIRLTLITTLVSASALEPEDADYLFSKRDIFRRGVITGDDVLQSYDFIIAGGGLAGLVLASRLSEDPGTTVLVLEAGLSGDAVADRINTPSGAYYSSIVGSDYDWQHVTLPQTNLSNRAIGWPRGKILGGSTAMNAMYLVRPASAEVDAWETLLSTDADTKDGASNWNWNNLYAAMKKSENFTAPLPEVQSIGNFSFNASTHGSGGPMQISYPGVMFTLVGNWTTALSSAGIPPLQSPNGGITLGGFVSPSSINPANWTRSYSRPAYFDSLPARSNLHVLPSATVVRLGFSDKTKSNAGELIANTVEFGSASDSVRFSVKVKREVILAGGPLGSPKVLMLSGVGPKDVLGDIGMDVVQELPGVGQHLQDHLTAGVVWQSNEQTAGDIEAMGTDFAKSPQFLSFINDAVAFVNSTALFGSNNVLFQKEITDALQNSTSLVPSTSPEVIEGHKAVYNLTANTFWPVSAQVEMLMGVTSPGTVSIQSAVQHPYSRGRVYINSTNPFDPIVIDPLYFSHFADRIIMRQGVKLVRQVGAGFGKSLGTEITPGPAIQSDDDLDNWLTTQGASTQYHPAGSCAMLPRSLGGVVNSKLKVYGLANVRVVDSSVYPYEFAAHLASATFGVAETASTIIKAEAFTVPNAAQSSSSQSTRVSFLAVLVASFLVAWFI